MNKSIEEQRKELLELIDSICTPSTIDDEIERVVKQLNGRKSKQEYARKAIKLFITNIRK